MIIGRKVRTPMGKAVANGYWRETSWKVPQKTNNQVLPG